MNKIIIFMLLFLILTKSLVSQEIAINEVMTSNLSKIVDEDGDYEDWIEIYNYSSSSINLENYSLSDNLNEPKKWIFPNITLAANSFLIVWASNKNKSFVGAPLHTTFKLSSSGEEITLYNPSGTIINSVKINALMSDNSFGRFPNGTGNWSSYKDPTPQNANIANTAIIAKVAINEVMSSNISSYADSDGDYSDWIELYNYGSVSIELKGFGLTDDPDLPYKWTFPDVTIAPNTFKIVWASNKNSIRADKPLHSNFKIGSSGEDIFLINNNEETVSFAPSTNLESDTSAGRNPDGTGNWVLFSEGTLGTTNNASLYSGNPEPPVFSHESGLYSANFNLSITHLASEATIVYTLDGSEPDINNLQGTSYIYKNDYPFEANSALGAELTNTYKSNTYSSAISINDRNNEDDKYAVINTNQYPLHTPSEKVRKLSIVKAKAFINGIGSKTIGKNYFVWPQGNPYNIPVVSIQVQENYLFGYEEGIYTSGKDFDDWRIANPDNNQGYRPGFNNYWRSGKEWEYPMHLEIFEAKNLTSLENINGGIRIHGNNSRAFKTKNLRLYARTEYDENSFFNFNPFDEIIYDAPDANNSKYDRMLLRGNGAGGSIFYDVVFNKLMQPVFSSGVTRVKPAIHFINGEFWGLTAFRDRLDQDHFRRFFDLDPDNIAIVGCNGSKCDLSEGKLEDYQDYINMRDFIIDNNLQDNNLFVQAETMLDMDSFINHMILQLISSDDSFERSYWRVKTPENDSFGDGRWRLSTQDFEASLKLFYNNDVIWIKHWASLTENSENQTIFGKLLQNESFKIKFLNRFADLLNTAFNKERFEKVVNDVYDEVSPYLAEDANKDPKENFFESNFEFNEKQNLIDWSNNQIPVIINQVKEEFNLAGTYNLTLKLSDKDAGYVKLNTVDIKAGTTGVSDDPFPWVGIYYDNIPITLTAIAKSGYIFNNWTGDITSSNATITLNKNDNTQVQANYTVDVEANKVTYFWLMDKNITNDLPLENINTTYNKINTQGKIIFQSCLDGYPFTDQDAQWRKSSMERVNAPTNLNYRPIANNSILFENAEVRGLQIKQPFKNNNQENILNLEFSTVHLKNAEVSFAAQTNGAVNSLIIEYWDGQNWTSTNLTNPNISITDTYAIYKVDFSSIGIANENANFKMRIRFDGPNLTSDTGLHVKFNNIAVDGDAVLSNETFNKTFILEAYPNPTQNAVQLKSNETIKSVVIYNLLGQKVKEIKNLTSEPKIDISNMQSGVYIFKVSWENRQENIKIIKN
jgi:hypothetical protein